VDAAMDIVPSLVARAKDKVSKYTNTSEMRQTAALKDVTEKEKVKEIKAKFAKQLKLETDSCLSIFSNSILGGKESLGSLKNRIYGICGKLLNS